MFNNRFCVDIYLGKKQILAVNQTTENLKHQQYLQNFRLNNKGQNRKLENNNDMVVMSGKRQRPMNSMLNKNRQKQATSQWKIYQQQQIISKNIIIRIWNKVLSNCYLPSIKGNEKVSVQCTMLLTVATQLMSCRCRGVCVMLK